MQRLNYDKAKPPLYERGVIRPGVDERFNHGALLFLPGRIVNRLFLIVTADPSAHTMTVQQREAVRAVCVRRGRREYEALQKA